MSEKKAPRQSRSRTHFKVFSEQVLFGSTRSELLPDERGVWFDFLCLASLNYGEVECFSRDQLSSQLLIERELLDRSVEKFIKTKKIRRNYKKREKKEIFPIVKWDTFQADYLKKPPKKSSTYKEKERVIIPEEPDTDKSPILEERRGDKTILKERRGKERREGDSEDSNLSEVETSSSPPASNSTSTPEEFSKGGRNSSALREEGNSRKGEFLAMLGACPGYPFDEHADGSYFLWAAEAYPDVDILKETAKKIQWWKDKPTALGDRSKDPHAQLSEWFEKHQEFINRRNNNEKRSNDIF